MRFFVYLVLSLSSAYIIASLFFGDIFQFILFALESRFESDKIHKGFTATAGGFYGPQGRVLRLPLQDTNLNNKIDSFNYNGLRITNLEMETSAIYGLSKLLGHNALSLNAIIANRAIGSFSSNPKKTVEDLILYTLDKI